MVTEPLECFDRKLNQLKSQKKIIETFSTVNTKATEASYPVALRIAKAGKPHEIDNTIQHCISDKAADVKEQLLGNIHKSPYFSNQLDKSTDVANSAQLMMYVCYINKLSVKEEFLFYNPLPACCTAEEIFKVLNDFIQEGHIDWGCCCGICTDGARAMTVCHSGLVKQVQVVALAAV